jgi:hypothetical protein
MGETRHAAFNDATPPPGRPPRARRAPRVRFLRSLNAAAVIGAHRLFVGVELEEVRAAVVAGLVQHAQGCPTEIVRTTIGSPKVTSDSGTRRRSGRSIGVIVGTSDERLA